MGVAFASGLSKNSTWDAPDAVVPVMKVKLGSIAYLVELKICSTLQPTVRLNPD